jgi:aminoglycoside phosphotransferase family enzyme
MKGKIKAYLERTFGTPVNLISIKELGLESNLKLEEEHEIKGFGYGKPYFVKFERGDGELKEVVISTMKGDGFGHDHFSDRAQVLIWQHHAFNTLPKHVRSLDVGYVTKDGRMESAGDAEEYFIVCDKVEGEEYVNDLNRLREGGSVRELDKERASALASYLADIHTVKNDNAGLYVRRIRELVGHNECIFGLTDSYPSRNEFITSEELKAIEKKCIDWRWKLKERTKRLCMVHGDFHPWNVMFRRGTDFTVLDRSRGEWGEAADDVSSMTINYLFFGLLKTNGKALDKDFKGLYETFFKVYLEKTGDYDLLELIQPFYAFRGLVVASPIWYPHISMDTRRKLFNFIRNVLKAEEFDYKGVDRYLEG